MPGTGRYKHGAASFTWVPWEPTHLVVFVPHEGGMSETYPTMWRRGNADPRDEGNGRRTRCWGWTKEEWNKKDKGIAFFGWSFDHDQPHIPGRLSCQGIVGGGPGWRIGTLTVRRMCEDPGSAPSDEHETFRGQGPGLPCSCEPSDEDCLSGQGEDRLGEARRQGGDQPLA